MAQVGWGRGRVRTNEANITKSLNNVHLAREEPHQRLIEALHEAKPLDKKTIEDMICLIIEEGNSAEKLPQVVSIVYNFGKENFINAEKCGCICEALDCFQAQNVKFRNVFLNQLQKDFMNRETLVKQDLREFLNIVNLHFEAFYHMKVNRTVPLKVLVPAILSYCELILEYPTDSSISLLCKQVLKCGPLIKSISTEFYNQLVATIRRGVLLPELPRGLQVRLLQTFEELLLGKPVDPEAAKFYAATIGN